MKSWILSFVSDVSKDIINEHVFNDGTFYGMFFLGGMIHVWKAIKPKKHLMEKNVKWYIMFRGGY